MVFYLVFYYWYGITEYRDYKTGNETGNENDVLILEAVVPCSYLKTRVIIYIFHIFYQFRSGRGQRGHEAWVVVWSKGIGIGLWAEKPMRF